MRNKLFAVLTLSALLAIGGCWSAPAATQQGQSSSLSSPTAVAGSTAVPLAESPSPQATAPASQKPLAASDPTAAAIQSVIEKANQAQQDAFARNDPTIMKDTATDAYYDEMAQTNADLARSGTKSIKLLKIEWGPISLVNETTAEATTYETWQTTYVNGMTDQNRDRNVYTLVLEQGVWKIQSDEHPDQPQPGGPGRVSVPPPGSTGPTARPVPAQLDVSRNWSGYAATSGKYTEVTGTWTVPQSNDDASFGAGATWVGIGGVSSTDLIQAGTSVMSGHPVGPMYEAWTEMLPDTAHPVSLDVNPGDSVTVSIANQGQDQWLISMKNNTTGKSYETTVQYSSLFSSAEWVHEAPSAGRRTLPLDNFDTVEFTGGTAIKDGKTVTIAQAGAKPITMADSSGSLLATPSALDAKGTGFSVTRSDNVSAPMPVPSLSAGRRFRGN